MQGYTDDTHFINGVYRWHDKLGRMTLQEISSGILLFIQTVNFHIHSVKSVRIWSYSNSVRMRENMDQNNYKFGQLLRSDKLWNWSFNNFRKNTVRN